MPQAVALSILPIANPDTLSTPHDRLATVPAPGVLGNDLDLLGSTTAVLMSGTAHGTVVLAPDGSYTYGPDAGFVGTDQFGYRDSGLLTNTTTVTITVTNAAPVAVDDSYTATTGVTLNVAAPGVLGNDHDADGDTITATLVDGGGNGSLSLASNGSFTFTSGGSFSGTRTFTYRVSDGIATSSIATVSIDVTPAATPTPAPTPSPAPTSTPTPAPTTSPTPIATPGPSGTPPPPPTRTPPGTPTPAPSLDPGASPTPGRGGGGSGATPPAGSPAPSLGSGSPAEASAPAPAGSPGSGSTGATGGSSTGGSTPNDPGTTGGGLDVGGTGSGASGALDPIDVLGALGLGPLLDWAVPALVLSVPGLLLVLAVLAQMLGGLIWLPLVRRWLGGLGFRRRRGATAG